MEKLTDQETMEKLLKGHVVTKNTARTVSLKRLHEWLEINANLTWTLSKYSDKCKNPRQIGAIKYLRPQFDTRTGCIFNISTDGWGEYNVDFREDFDGDILDLLEYKIKNKLTVKRGESDG